MSRRPPHLLALLLLCATAAATLPRPALAQNPFLERREERLIGKIEFVGAKVTKEYVLRRELGLATGDVYSWSALTDARERLESLSFIEYVVIEEDFPEPNTVDLLVTVNEDDRLMWAPRAAYERRHDGYVVGLDLALKNFRGRGETIAARTSWWKKHGYELHWDNPSILGPAALSLRADLSWEFYDFRYEEFDFRNVYFELGVGRQLGPWLRAEIAGQIREGLLETKNDSFTDVIQRDDALLLLLEHDSRDLRYYPTKGIHAWASSRFGGLGEELDYSVHRLHLAAFWNIPYIDILAARVEQRLTSDPLPLYERSYLGGPQSLRGIEFGSIEGDRHFLLTFEVRRPIFLMKLLEGRALGVGVHAFHDWGKAYEHDAGFDSAAIHRSWGAGIHFNFNTRNFRVEWARSEDGDDSILFEDNFSF